MAIYEFHCPRCEKDFEELIRSAGGDAEIACPHCGSRRVRRKLSVFAARSATGPTPSPSIGACGRCGDPNGPCSE